MYLWHHLAILNLHKKAFREYFDSDTKKKKKVSSRYAGEPKKPQRHM